MKGREEGEGENNETNLKEYERKKRIVTYK